MRNILDSVFRAGLKRTHATCFAKFYWIFSLSRSTPGNHPVLSTGRGPEQANFYPISINNSKIKTCKHLRYYNLNPDSGLATFAKFAISENSQEKVQPLSARPPHSFDESRAGNSAKPGSRSGTGCSLCSKKWGRRDLNPGPTD